MFRALSVYIIEMLYPGAIHELFQVGPGFWPHWINIYFCINCIKYVQHPWKENLSHTIRAPEINFFLTLPLWCKCKITYIGRAYKQCKVGFLKQHCPSVKSHISMRLVCVIHIECLLYACIEKIILLIKTCLIYAN